MRSRTSTLQIGGAPGGTIPCRSVSTSSAEGDLSREGTREIRANSAEDVDVSRHVGGTVGVERGQSSQRWTPGPCAVAAVWVQTRITPQSISKRPYSIGASLAER